MPTKLMPARRWLRWSLYCLLLLGLLSVLATFALPTLLRPWLENQASSALKRQVSIGGIALNPYLLTLRLNDVTVKDGYGVFVQFKQLTLDAEMASLLRMSPIVREITLDSAHINLVRVTPTHYNFSDLIPPKSEQPDPPLPKFSLNNIRLINSQIRLDDKVAGQSQLLDQLNIALPFISNFAPQLDTWIQPRVEGRFNGTPFALEVKSKPFKQSLDTSLTLKFDGQNLSKLLAYAPLPQGLSVPAATLSANLDLTFRQQAKQAEILLDGQISLDDFSVNANNAPLLRGKQIRLELKDMKPLLQEFSFRQIALKGLQLHARRDAKGQFNWQQFAGSKSSAATSLPAAQPRFAVAQFSVSESQILWQDEAVKPAFSSTIEGIQLDLKNFSNQAKTAFPLQLQAQIDMAAQRNNHDRRDKNPPARLNAALQILPKPFGIVGNISATGLAAEKFSPYYRAFLPASLVGTVGMATDVKFDAQSGQWSLDKTQLAIDNFTLTLPKQRKPVLQIKQFQLADMALDSGGRKLVIGKLASSHADLQLRLLKDGQLNLLQALPVGQSSSGSANKPSPPNQPTQPTWGLQLAQAHLAEWAVSMQDESLDQSKPMIWKNIDLQLSHVDIPAGGKKGGSAQLTLKASGARGAKITLAGPWVPQPFSGKFKLDLTQLDAVMGQPYFSKYLNISLASGFLHAKGELQLVTQPQFGGSYKGMLRSTNFYALDKNTGADFLKWNSLVFGAVHTQFNPLKVEIGEIALSDFYSRLILSADGRLNLQDVMVKNGESVSVTTEHPAKPTASGTTSPVAGTTKNTTASTNVSTTASAPTIPISIGKITLSGGNISYSDLFIKPNFTANLTDMGGVIAGLSSQNDSRASIDLRGSVDRIAPVVIKGKLNPLAQDLFIDMAGGVTGYELTNASAYAIKYAGYGVQKGKLSMEVSYLIENKVLKANNQLFLDQLTLGDAVESPTATKLPVKFALALLKDRNGQIKLNLPIEGSLADPQFSVSGIVLQVIGNVLQKIVTAPFAALSGLFDSGPTLSRVEYAPGRAVLDDKAKLALKNLSQVLQERPGLQLEISGWASAEMDAEGLRQQLLNNKMLALKATNLGNQAESVNSEAEVALSAQEIPVLMAQVYKKENFPKPKNLIGLSKTLPVAEMQKLILANTVITDENLKSLATQRAQRVKNALKDAGVDDSRMFITQANSHASSKDTQDDKGSLARVQFSLK